MSPSAQTHSVSYGNVSILFSLNFSRRKTLSISVNPDLSVTVTAPEGAVIEKVKQKVQKRASWIVKQKDYFAQFLPAQTQRIYRSGETHLYLGKQYRLKIEKAEAESIKLKSGRLFVRVKETADPQRIEALLNDWFKARAKERFSISLQKCWETVRRQKIIQPKLRLRKMVKRWGSCTPTGIIYLNSDLIKAPSHCIEYVITHELCHLKYPHHGTEFYSLLGRVMPDWEKRKKRLEMIRI